MSVGESCQSCKLGKLRPFQLSTTEAIVKCENTDCDGYLDLLPNESLVATANAENRRKKGRITSSSSRSVSGCSSPALIYSPAQSLGSLTDQEVAHLNSATYNSSKPTLFSSGLIVQRATLPAPAKLVTRQTELERFLPPNIESLDEVDRFLDSLTEDEPPPTQPANIGIPSHCSAFSQIPHTDNVPNDSRQQNSQIDNNELLHESDSCDDKPCSPVSLLKADIAISCDTDPMMLDEKQFLSPSGSAVSEDSGYNDEIASAVAVSEAGARSGQATTKTTNCTMLPTSSHQQLSSSSSYPTAETQSVMSQCSVPHQSHRAHSSSVAATLSASSTDESFSPDNTELPLSLLLPESTSPNCYTDHADSPSPTQKELDLHISDHVKSTKVLSLPDLNYTEFISIYEQNLVHLDNDCAPTLVQSHASMLGEVDEAVNSEVTSESSKCQSFLKCSDKSTINDKMETCFPHIKNSLQLSESSSECFSESLESTESISKSQARPENFSTDPSLGKSSTIRNNQFRDITISGRPRKRKYKRQLNDVTDTLSMGNKIGESAKLTADSNPNSENVTKEACQLLKDTSVDAIEIKPKSHKRKKTAVREYENVPRKSARKQPIEECCDGRKEHNTRCERVTNATTAAAAAAAQPHTNLANVRPSLAALLPPILPHNSLNKHSCPSGRSSKRLKPSQPFRQLAS